LFKQTDVKISFRATNTIQQQLNTAKHRQNDPSGIYKLKCNAFVKVYVGHFGRAIGIRFKEHIRYIRSNNSTSAYVAHILEKGHECGTKENTQHLFNRVAKGNTWVAVRLSICRHYIRNKY